MGLRLRVSVVAGFQEARLVRGVDAKHLIGAMAPAFAVGQIAALVGVSYVVRADGGFSEALVIAGLLLIVTANLLFRRPGPGAHRPVTR